MRDVQGTMTIEFDRVDVLTNEAAVEQFVERLATLSIADWLSIATSVTQTASERVQANDALDQVITQDGLGFDAWSIGDDVETAFHCSVGATGVTPSPRDCLSLAIAREAATRAALALFVGSLLSAADFDSLYRPFASLVPPPTETKPRRSNPGEPPLRLVPRPVRERRRGMA